MLYHNSCEVLVTHSEFLHELEFTDYNWIVAGTELNCFITYLSCNFFLQLLAADQLLLLL